MPSKPKISHREAYPSKSIDRTRARSKSRITHREAYPSKMNRSKNNNIFNELKLDDGTEFLWMFLKNDDDIKLKLKENFPVLNDLFPFIKTYSFTKSNDFRDYLHNYITKPCKIIIDFDNREYYNIFKFNFIHNKYGTLRDITEQNKIVKYLFSEFKGETKFHICNNTHYSNILFYKVRELDIMIRITNEKNYFGGTSKMTINKILQLSCNFITPEKLRNKHSLYYFFYYILMLFGSTSQCDMKQINGTNLDNFRQDLTFSKKENLPHIFNLSVISSYDRQAIEKRLPILLSIYEEYMDEVIKL